MIWQDIIIALVQWTLLLALFPTIFHPTHKPALWSSVMSGSLLCILGFTFATLDLWQSVLSSFGAAAGWFILAYQRWKLNRKDVAPLQERAHETVSH